MNCQSLGALYVVIEMSLQIFHRNESTPTICCLTSVPYIEIGRLTSEDRKGLKTILARRAMKQTEVVVNKSETRVRHGVPFLNFSLNHYLRTPLHSPHL
jgi:hypothetical protein